MKKFVIMAVLFFVILSEAFASTKMDRNPRVITFAGREWYVKSGYGGPGPNYRSDSNQNVWVDTNGWLHLRIRYSGGIWYCSEVNTTDITCYGIHRFYVIGRLDSLDRNVVFATFIYSNDTTEVDIEVSTWGDAFIDNLWYVIHPSSHPGNVESFLMQLSGTYTTHYFNWRLDSIRFKSIHGHYEEPPNSSFLIHQWLYTGSDIPLQDENLKIHINLWLYQGIPPSNGEDVEIIVKDVDLPQIGVFEEEDVVLDGFYNFGTTIISGPLLLPEGKKCKVFDITGKIVTPNNLKPGVYFVEINGMVTKKIVKIK